MGINLAKIISLNNASSINFYKPAIFWSETPKTNSETSFNKIKPTKNVEAIKRIIETVLTNSQSIFIPSIPIFSSAKNGSILHFDKIKIAVSAPPIGSIYFDDSSSKKSKKVVD